MPLRHLGHRRSVSEDYRLHLTHVLLIGNDLDRQDPAPCHDEVQKDTRVATRCPRRANNAVEQHGTRLLRASEERVSHRRGTANLARKRRSALVLGCGGQGNGDFVGSEHNVRIKHGKQRLEVTFAGGSKERLDDFPLTRLICLAFV
ncbi:hypothetical protein SAMN04489726_4492 [Allokutzneria albata]|uniref:Uncharacterized protein n=1 Tax=Allokutzneria albata TaxID=211114 RepID=A0A1G9XZ01_ALLAB|nr:hypothetical protein SAMN04489726_4492 [Allokutzneria albata]